MNSLLSLQGTPSPASGLPTREAAAADPAGSRFSFFLTSASIAPEAVAGLGEEAVPSLQMPAEALPPGIGLPPVAGTGKFLPSGLIPAPGEAPAEEEDPGERLDDVAALPIVAQQPLPVLPQPITSLVVATSGAGPFSPPAAGAMLLSLPTSSASSTSDTLVALPEMQPVEARSHPGKSAAVVLAMVPAPPMISARGESPESAPRAGRFGLDLASPPVGEPAPADPLADRRSGQMPAKDAADRFAARFAAPAADAPVASLASAEPAPSPSLLSSLNASVQTAPLASGQPQPMHELSALVDRLAAARGALAPATAALALNHAEFGELTLRFEQQDDGQLVVGLSAATPEAHRAVAAALAAERTPSSNGDKPADQQHQSGQARAGNGTGNAGSGFDRGGSSGQGSSHSGSGHGRHDAPRGNPTPQGWRPAPRSESPTGGIYA
jgi:hypothetical protein